MNIFVIAFGTRGDVQPMLAIAKALQRRGHRVNLCAPDNFRNFVETQHGVTFHPIGVDFQEIMAHPEVKIHGRAVFGRSSRPWSRKFFKQPPPLPSLLPQSSRVETKQRPRVEGASSLAQTLKLEQVVD